MSGALYSSRRGAKDAPPGVAEQYSELYILVLAVRVSVETLPELGSGIALDDFGTGYSPLAISHLSAG